MVTRRIARTLPALLAVLVVVGCAEAPTREIEAARDAIDAAETAEAPAYAPDAWVAAQDAQAALEAEMAAQEQSYALFRSYDKTRALADAAKTAGERAAADAQAGKELARNEATRIIDEAKALREEVRALLADAPQGKGTSTDLAALRADTGTTATSLQEAEDALRAGKYLDAKAKAEAAMELLNRVKSEIETARQARGGRA